MSNLETQIRRSKSSALVLLALTAAFAACSKTGDAPGTFGVNVTVDATMIPAAQRAKITTDKLTVVSDKGGAPFVHVLPDLPKAIQGGTVRFHFTPATGAAAGDQLTFTLEVLNGTALIGSGTAGPIALKTEAVSLTIRLVGPGDGGTGPDVPGTDGGQNDGGNIDVGAGEVVNPNGKANGVTCTTDAECGTAFCTDGVCCNERCNDVCASCGLPSSKGTCTAYAVDTDPENECAAKIPVAPMMTDAGASEAGTSDAGPSGDAGASTDGGASDALVINTPDGGLMSMPTTCGGKCGGARACKFPDKTKSCGTAFCNTDKVVASFACDGNGGCAIAVNTCTNYVCDGTKGACRTQCAEHADCQPGLYCDGATHQCVDKKGLALTCVTDDECKSTHCSSSVCCNTACDTAPLSCNSSGSVGQCKCAECSTGPCQIYYPDVDGDTFGDRTATYATHTAKAACVGAPPAGFVADNTDCDDSDLNAHPGQTMFFGFTSKGGRFDYDCDDKTTKETPEYPGGSCKFCGGLGACDSTTPSTQCTSTSQTGSFQCPQEYGGVRGTLSEPVSNVPVLGAVGIGTPLGEEATPYLSSVAPGGSQIAVPVQPPICIACILQCCGCQPNDKNGFRQVVACGDTSVPMYTCGGCSAVPGTPVMTTSFKQQRCR